MNDTVPLYPRLARFEDADAVRDLVQAAYGHYVMRMNKLPGPMLDNYRRRIVDSQAWVIEAGGRLLGMIVLEDLPGQCALLLANVAVVPSAQGRGHGRALIAFAEKETRRRGYGEVRLYTNVLMSENQALYARLGFRETGRTSEGGYDRVHMAKSVGMSWSCDT